MFLCLLDIADGKPNFRERSISNVSGLQRLLSLSAWVRELAKVQLCQYQPES
jgi:hypothetical protein